MLDDIRDHVTSSNYSVRPAYTALACAAYVKQRATLPELAEGAHLDMLNASVLSMLSALAVLHQSMFPGWKADATNPGYLVRQVPPAFFRVPVHLAPLFPDDASLREVWELAHRIRTDESSIIYISGSSAVRRIFEYVDDIDFCEYMPKSGRQLAASVLLKLSDSRDQCCMQVAFDNHKWLRPLISSNIAEQLEMASHDVLERSRVKLQYVAKREQTRPFDVSNVIIVCNEHFQSKGSERTFAYQEGQVAAVDYVPNRLTNALELGRYILFLIDEVEHYRARTNPLKALKRALSLTRVCWLNDFSMRIKTFLDSSCLMIDHEIATCHRIQECLDRFDGDAWRAEVQKVKDHLRVLNAERQAFHVKEAQAFPTGADTVARQIVQEVIAIVTRLSGGVLIPTRNA